MWLLVWRPFTPSSQKKDWAYSTAGGRNPLGVVRVLKGIAAYLVPKSLFSLKTLMAFVLVMMFNVHKTAQMYCKLNACSIE